MTEPNVTEGAGTTLDSGNVYPDVSEILANPEGTVESPAAEVVATEPEMLDAPPAIGQEELPAEEGQPEATEATAPSGPEMVEIVDDNQAIDIDGRIYTRADLRELRAGYMKEQDYRHKTMQVAETRKAIEPYMGLIRLVDTNADVAQGLETYIRTGAWPGSAAPAQPQVDEWGEPVATPPPAPEPPQLDRVVQSKLSAVERELQVLKTNQYHQEVASQRAQLQAEQEELIRENPNVDPYIIRTELPRHCLMTGQPSFRRGLNDLLADTFRRKSLEAGAQIGMRVAQDRQAARSLTAASGAAGGMAPPPGTPSKITRDYESGLQAAYTELSDEYWQ